MELNKIYQGDCLEILKRLPDESIDMVMTSPPYWNLRDYNVDGQLGQESTFQEYICNLCDIFDEIKRVLKVSGTCFVNIGDTYGGSGQGSGKNVHIKGKQATNVGSIYNSLNNRVFKTNYIDKCLVQIPNRFSIEMVDRGWILRNEIIWHKPNQYPSSVKDRFTVDYEKLFFFTKNKKYYFEQQFDSNANDRNMRSVWSINTQPLMNNHVATYPEKLCEIPILGGCPENGVVLDPFMGSGTTAIVAKKLNRNYVGIELNSEYIDIANERIDLCDDSIKIPNNVLSEFFV